MKNLNNVLTDSQKNLCSLEEYAINQTAEDKAADIAAKSIAYIKANTICVISLPKGYYADLKKSARGLFKTIKAEMLQGLKHEIFARKCAEISSAMVGSNDPIVRLAGEMIAGAGRNASMSHTYGEGAIVASASTLTQLVEVYGKCYNSSFKK